MTVRIRYYILNEQGEPVAETDLFKWAAWFETAHRSLSNDYDEGDGDKRVRVSTVFLGLDHSFGDGPPVLWETLVFGGVMDGEMRRYTSREAALIGHQDICQRVNATLQHP